MFLTTTMDMPVQGTSISPHCRSLQWLCKNTKSCSLYCSSLWFYAYSPDVDSPQCPVSHSFIAQVRLYINTSVTVLKSKLKFQLWPMRFWCSDPSLLLQLNSFAHLLCSNWNVISAASGTCLNGPTKSWCQLFLLMRKLFP